MEEVTAWSSYESTARPARDLRPACRHGSIVFTSTSNAPTDATADPEDLRVRFREETGASTVVQSEYRANWIRHFQPLLQDDQDEEEDLEKEGRDKDLEEQDGKTDKGSELSPEEQERLESIQNGAHSIFAVYFDDAVTREEVFLDSTAKSFWSTLVSLVTSFNATMPWLPGWIEKTLPVPSVFRFVELCMRGIGQVFFLNNPMSGLMIGIGLFLQSPRVAAYGLLALATGNFTAMLLGFNAGLQRSGLFGYNAVLVGLAMATFDTSTHPSQVPLVLATVVASGFTVVLFTMMGKLLVPYKSPPLTLPFNVATLMVLLAVANMDHWDMDPVQTPGLPYYDLVSHTHNETTSGVIIMSPSTADDDDDEGQLSAADIVTGIVRGVGQVFLCNDLAAGLVVWAGIAVCSRILAAAALVGSALGLAVAVLMGVPADALVQGMYGFNASLSVTAMFLFYTPSYGTLLLGLLAGTVTVLGQQALATYLLPYGLPFMTLPFCVVALPFIIMQGTTSLVTAIPLASITTPEDHWKRVHVLQNGFHFLLEAMEEESSGNGTDDHRMAFQKYGRKASQNMSKLQDSIRFHQDVNPNDDSISSSCWPPCKKSTSLSKQDRWVSDVAISMFDQIDSHHIGSITVRQFIEYLRTIGLSNDTGVAFVSKALTLLDLDDSGTIEKDEFVAFSLVSRSLSHVKEMNAQFFNFVDTDGSQDVDFEELDAALEYLGQPMLSDTDRERLHRISGGRDSFDTVDIVNFVTISKLKVLVAAYHAEQNALMDRTASETTH